MSGDTSEVLRVLLAALPEDTSRVLAAHGFDPDWLVDLAERMQAGTLPNHVAGSLAAPAPSDIVRLPEPGTAEHGELTRLGEEALRRGECALLVLAGGMATRMGGVVKSLLDALPGRTFLDLRLAEQQSIAAKYGKHPPLWLMTSHATDAATRAALGGRLGQHVHTFVQNLSVRLTPDGSLFRNDAGEVSLHAPGHGDLPEALRRSRLLDEFRERGGKYVMVANIDNLGAGLEPALIGLHLARGLPVTCEVVDKVGSDRGGIPVVHDGKLVVLEEFRIPPTFDPSVVRVFNSNTFGFDADALANQRFPFTFFRVEKQVDGRQAIQFERLVGEVTSMLPTGFVLVERDGPRSRFLPVKDVAELDRRAPEIHAVASARGMLDEAPRGAHSS